jgi:hypothetical protein
METLNEYAVQHGNSRYVLLRTGQLVGAALLLFAREDVLNDIKNVEGDVKKVYYLVAFQLDPLSLTTTDERMLSMSSFRLVFPE